MSLNDKINSIRNLSGAWAERIGSELAFAASLSLAKSHCYDEIVERSADSLLASIKKDGGVITKSSALMAEEILLPLKEEAKHYRVHCVAHAHIDMNWMWGFQETASVTVDTFRTVLDLMKEYPTLTFAQSQASTYKIIEEYAPEMLEEIKELIREGRWEVSASTWVETDKNMPNGESLARHILYTKRYLSNLLDIPAESLNLDFEPDTFGHNISVPEICSKGGVKYYYHCRGNGDDEFAYRWRARSGAELIVWREPAWYNFTIEGNMFRNIPQLCERYGIDTYLSVYGVGDHGGGPTRRDVERLIEISSWPIMPTIMLSTYGKFFKELEAYRDKLPVREGELNFIFTGCYTSQSRIKMSNRIAEDRMYESEMLSSAAHILADSPRYNQSYTKAWEHILFNHFHDVLPGSGVVDTREYALGHFQRAMAAIQTNANRSMRAIAEAIDTSSITTEISDDSISEGAGSGFSTNQINHYLMPSAERGMGKKRILHLFNTTQYDFDGVTDITVWDWNFETENAVFTDINGNSVKSVCIEDEKGYWGHFYKTFAVKVEVPAFGYATYILDCAEEKDYIAPVATRKHGHTDDYGDDDLIMENDKLRAVFDHRTMQIISLVDKANSKELISVPSATFRLIHENIVHGMTSWRVGEYMTVENLNETRDVVVDEVSLNSICKTVKYHLNFGERSSLEVIVKLTDGSSMLDFDVAVDFHEIKHTECVPQLNFTFPVRYSVSNYRYDVPFGTIDRPEIKHDVPANSYGVALPKEDENAPAIILTSDTKYGFRGDDNALSLSLIRACGNPDPYPEYGKHNIRIGVGVVDNCNIKTISRAVAKFTHPISVCSARAGKGVLPLNYQLFSMSGDVLVSTVKTAEDNDGIVLRLSNPYSNNKECKFTFTKTLKSAYLTDINENITQSLDANGNETSVTVEPYSIKTLLVVF